MARPTVDYKHELLDAISNASDLPPESFSPLEHYRRSANLIIKETDPSNKRRQQLRLTKKGEALIQQIEEILYGDQAPELSGQETSQGDDQEL